MLTRPEVLTVVNDFIGVDAGYLNGFSYRTHSEFYPIYCGLDIDPDKIEGTTRSRFLTIINGADAPTQSKILKGVLTKFPIRDFPEALQDKKAAIANEIERWIARLDGNGLIEAVGNLAITNSTVEKAIADAKLLIEKKGAVNGLDRVHTALHGYLIAVATKSGIELGDLETNVQILKKLKAEHPALNEGGTRQDDINQIIISFGNVLDKLNPIRNNATLAHPNEVLLGEDEAYFVINAAQTVLNYLNRKFKND